MHKKAVRALSMIYQNKFLNQSIIFIHTLKPSRGSIFCVRSQDTKKFHVYAHNFSVSLFSSSGTHQSHHPDGCQANQFYGACLNIALIFILTSLGWVEFYRHFHNPHFHGLVHHQNLHCWLYAQQLKQAQYNYQVYTQKDSLNSPFDL